MAAAYPEAAGEYVTLSERAVIAGPLAMGAPVISPRSRDWPMARAARAERTAERMLIGISAW